MREREREIQPLTIELSSTLQAICVDIVWMNRSILWRQCHPYDLWRCLILKPFSFLGALIAWKSRVLILPGLVLFLIMSYNLHRVCTNSMFVDFGSFKPPVLLALKLMFVGITKVKQALLLFSTLSLNVWLFNSVVLNHQLSSNPNY